MSHLFYQVDLSLSLIKKKDFAKKNPHYFYEDIDNNMKKNSCAKNQSRIFYLTNRLEISNTLLSINQQINPS